jgi:hypothetical protein
LLGRFAQGYDRAELLEMGWDPHEAPGRAALLLAVGAAGGGAALAVASVPDGSGLVSACYQVTAAGATVPVTTPGNVRIIDPSANQHCNTAGLPAGALERPLTLGATWPRDPPV